MIDEHKLIRDSARAAQAQSLLDSDILKEAFAQLEASYIEMWRSTNALDQPGREKLFIAVNVVGKVRGHLELAVQNGKVAAKDLADLAKDTERKKRFGIV